MPRGAFAACTLTTEDVCILDGHHKWQRGRGHPSSFSFGAAPAPGGYGAAPAAAPAPGGYGAAPGSPAAAPAGGEKKPTGKTMEWKAKDGETYNLPSESKAKCLEECKNEPWVARAQAKQAQGGMMAGMGGMGNMVAGADPMTMKGDCIRYCQTELAMQCFPGSSTVLVRDRGRVKLTDICAGDLVLSAQRRQGTGPVSKSGAPDDGWELLYDEVLTFLHYERDGEGDVIHIRHALGGLHLTADHLVFVRRVDGLCHQDGDRLSAAAAVRARDVQPGDHVLAPWIDGSVSAVEVQEIETIWTNTGMFAPLTTSGMLLVDGTLVSCYALPENLLSIPAYQCLFETIGGHCIQETLHCFLLPLRLSCKTMEIMASRAEAATMRAATALFAARTLTAPTVSTEILAVPGKKSTEPGWAKDMPIHPYPWFLYVLFASVLT